MNKAPPTCPLCTNAVLRSGGSTYDDVELKYFVCLCKNYSCFECSDNVFSEVFIQNLFEIRVHYTSNVYQRHSITIYSDPNRSGKIEFKLNDEDFIGVFSRDNLHPLLGKLEKYEVFS